MKLGYAIRMMVVLGVALFSVSACMSDDTGNNCTGAQCGANEDPGNQAVDNDPASVSYPQPNTNTPAAPNTTPAADPVIEPVAPAAAALPTAPMENVDEAEIEPVAAPEQPINAEPATPQDPTAPQMALPMLPERETFHAMNLPDMAEFVEPAIMTEDQINPEWTNLMRDAINVGLPVGRENYIESVSVALQQFGIPNYEWDVQEGFLEPDLQQIEVCPFAQHLGNDTAQGLDCNSLIWQASVQTYARLSQIIAENPIQVETPHVEWVQDAQFWNVQATMSGIDQARVWVQFDLQLRGLCYNQAPTPAQSSYDKGLLVGRQLMVDRINAWLAARGVTPDYPTMSSPIRVCNANQAVLDVARSDAHALVTHTAQNSPLCPSYEPPTMDAQFQYNQALIDYKEGIDSGVDAEFSVAAVRVFQVVSCNVSDPVVVDVDKDGIELMSLEQGVNFDMNANGHKVAMGWVAPDDALLAIDRDGNGLIDNGSELFGNVEGLYADGFAQLATLDSNRDGLLTWQDGMFADLLVWQDRDSDGMSTPDELAPLASLGVDTIALAAQDVGLTIARNDVPKLSTMTGADVTLTCGDAFLRTGFHANPLR